MISSPEPWSIWGNELRDAYGSTIATFKDHRDADRVIEALYEEGAALVEKDEELKDMEREIDQLNEECGNLEDEIKELKAELDTARTALVNCDKAYAKTKAL